MARAQIKNEKAYEKLRDKGASKEKAARIANAEAKEGSSEVGRRGGKSSSYTDWSKDDLMKRAREIGVKGRSSMTKAQLVDALRNH
ncbi:Rho termination factor [Spirillospora sp. NPDC050679]